MLSLLFVFSIGFAAEQKLYTQTDLKSSVCWALCRQDGYYTGSYEKVSDQCMCANPQKFKDITKQAIKIPSSMKITVANDIKKQSKTEYNNYFEEDND